MLMKKYKLIIALVATLYVMSASAAAVTTAGGYLTGASRVDIGGSFYDVTFLGSGSCAAAYDGCDEVSDFFFQSLAEANAASQALLDQVFLDTSAGDFDSFPGLTLGSVSTLPCWATTVYGMTADDKFFMASHALNFSFDWWAGENDGVRQSAKYLPSYRSTNLIYAQWSHSADISEVPIPATVWLLGSGLLGLAGAIKKRKNIALAKI
jgi:hypothetical protein